MSIGISFFYRCGNVNDLCPQCREELGVMDLLEFGL